MKRDILKSPKTELMVVNLTQEIAALENELHNSM